MIIDVLSNKYIEDIDAINQSSFTDPWSINLIKQDMSNPDCYYVVAVEDGRAVGYAGIMNIAGEANITNIAVSSDQRRKGIGKALLGKLIDYCLEHKYILITLEVRKSNESAISLYDKMGFSVEGERKNYYSDNGENALIMTRHF